jgi:hypothetical protein
VIDGILKGIDTMEVEGKKERAYYVYTFLRSLFKLMQEKHIPLRYEDGQGTVYTLEEEGNDDIKYSKRKINPASGLRESK